MNCDEDSNSGILKRLSVNTRLSEARIFDEDLNDFPRDTDKKMSGKMKSAKRDNKGSPYKTNGSERKVIEYESDPDVLQRRQKQIDYGKNTIGYDHYLTTIPLNKRKKDHPRTPNKYLKYSRRGWDCLVKIWRMKLHEFDPKDITEDNQETENGESSSTKESNSNSESLDDDNSSPNINDKDNPFDFI